MEINAGWLVASVLVWLLISLPVWVLYFATLKRHDREIERIHESYSTVLTAKANVEQYGRATLPPAVTEDVGPAPEERAAFEASQEAIERGARQLGELYASMGVDVTDEELRDEARSIIMADRAPRPHVLEGLVSD